MAINMHQNINKIMNFINSPLDCFALVFSFFFYLENLKLSYCLLSTTDPDQAFKLNKSKVQYLKPLHFYVRHEITGRVAKAAKKDQTFSACEKPERNIIVVPDNERCQWFNH